MADAGGLTIGGAKDPAETRADARATQALATAPTIHRECTACAADETAQRSPAAGVIAPGAAPAPASESAATAVNSLGPGRPLSSAERGFYEPRLNADLSPVRLHEDATADNAARAIDASAFTLGTDIAFARGERARGGPRLMADDGRSAGIIHSKSKHKPPKASAVTKRKKGKLRSAVLLSRARRRGADA